MFNVTGSVAALCAAVLACLALMFIWGGTEEVRFNWVAMDDDYTPTKLAEIRNPIESYDYDPNELDSGQGAAAVPMKDGDNYVLWLNISGFRADYLEKAETPFLDEAGGSKSSKLRPTFPALHWSSLISQATGRTADGHGVSGNTMRDPETKEVLKFPSKLALLKAEPIWTTAKRQGLPVLVHDWPFSQVQPAENAADVFKPEFDLEASDEDRLNALFDAWTSYKGEKKLRLIMGSLHGIHKAAQTHGTREEDTIKAITDLDSQLKAFFEKVQGKWSELSNEGDKLVVVLTTDHGMVDAEKLINFKELMAEMADQVDYTVDEGVANIWFKDPPDGMSKEDFIENYDAELKKRIYWRSFAPADFPSDWKLAAEGGHIGDRLLLLKPPYAFHTEKGSEAVYAPAETGGPFAASGYWVNDSARMLGQMFSFELGGGGYGSDLGDVDATRLHASVCKVLKIEPASDLVNAEALDLD